MANTKVTTGVIADDAITSAKIDSTSTGMTFADLTVTGEITANGGIALGDNDKATFGDSDDLQIYHTGTYSSIRDAGTGALYIGGDDEVSILNASLTEYKIKAETNGAVTLYYDNAAKLATTSSGIDVTGTVTSDGLTVDGDIEISDTTPSLLLMESDTTDVNTRLLNNGGDFFLSTINDVKNSVTNRLSLDHATGDIAFYEDTGTTAKLFWDASAESLGIGTSSPDTLLHLSANTGATLTLESTDTVIATNEVIGAIDFYSNDASGIGAASRGSISLIAEDAAGAGSIVLKTSNASTAASEKVRVTSSGNVGIGTSSPNQSSAGTQHSVLTLKGSGTLGNGIFELIQKGTSGNNQTLGDIRFFDDTNQNVSIEALRETSTDSGYLTFKTRPAAGSLTERMRIDSSGIVGINTTASNQFDGTPKLIVGSGSGDSGIAVYTGSTSAGYLQFGDGTSGAEEYRGFIKYDHSANSMSFSTNSTARSEAEMTIDSSGNVGIGLTNPSDYYATSLVVSASAEKGITIAATATNAANYIMFADGTTGDAQFSGFISYGHANNELGLRSAGFTSFATGGGTERMRITSGGRVIVGGTAEGDATSISLNENGYIYAKSSHQFAGIFDRDNSEGDIVLLRQNGVSVGSIGVDSTDNLYFAGGTGSTKGIYLNDVGVIPATTGGAGADNAVDLGQASVRFKNLYLAGGVYVGGTGAANYLDDYEEGTCTMTLGSAGTQPTVSPNATFTASYTKIGNLVRVTGYTGGKDITNIGTGVPRITGLPFTSSSTYYGHVAFYHSNRFTSNSVGGYVEVGNTYFYPIPTGTVTVDVYATGTRYLMFQAVYIAA
jgi:hypothetical protein